MTTNTLIFTFTVLILSSCQQNQLPQNAIPINFDKHIYLQGKSNGIAGRYVFDTGARNLFLDKTHHAEHNFNFINTFTADLIGVGTTPKTIDVIADTVKFEFGMHTYLTPNVPIIDLRSILGDHVDGVLGVDYFENDILEINFEQAYIKKFNSIDTINLEGYSRIELVEKEHAKMSGLEIGDKIISINGSDVNTISREQQKTYFDNHESVELTIDRKGKLLAFSFPLAPVIDMANDE